jgi:hypothetical protein
MVWFYNMPMPMPEPKVTPRITPMSTKESRDRRERVSALALDKAMEAIGSLIDEKIKADVTYRDDPYYSGQVYEAEKDLREALLNLLDAHRDCE